MHAENKMCKYGSTCNQRLRFVFLQYAELDDERFTLECAKDSSLNNYIRDTWQVVRSLIVMDDTEAKFRCANTPAASLFLLTLLFVTSLHPIFCAVLFKCPLSFPLQLSFRPTGYPLIIADVVILKSSLLSPPWLHELVWTQLMYSFLSVIQINLAQNSLATVGLTVAVFN